MGTRGYVRRCAFRYAVALFALLGMVGEPLLVLAQAGRTVTRPRVVSPRPPAAPTSTEDVEVEDNVPSSTSRSRPILGRRGEDAPRPSVPAPATDVDDDIITIQATLVTIPVVVSDDYNRYLPFLQKSHFSLFEDNVPQEITFFASERVPFHVAIVLDVSRSACLSIDDMCSAANAFIDCIRPEDRVSIFTFSDKIRQLCPFTSHQATLRQAVARAKIEAGTRLYDATYQILDTYLAPIEGRKAMVLLTDGEDTTSRHHNPRDVLKRVAESDVLVYTVQYPSADPSFIQPPLQFPFPFPFPLPLPRPPRSRRGPFLPLDASQGGGINQQWPAVLGTEETFLRDIATISGGTHNTFTDIGTARTIFRNLAEELRHVYVLGYYPTRGLDQPGYRRVRVRVNHPEAKVRARPGYMVTEQMARRNALPAPSGTRD